MLTSYYRKQLEAIHEGCGDFHREWIEGLIWEADRGNQESEDTLKLFLKFRRKTDRTSVAYAMVMDKQAQTQIRGLEDG